MIIKKIQKLLVGKASILSLTPKKIIARERIVFSVNEIPLTNGRGREMRLPRINPRRNAVVTVPI